MKAGWLIDGDMFHHYRDELVAEIKSQGHTVKQVHALQPPYRRDDARCSFLDAFPNNHCVVSHGDIELVTKIQRENRWIPGAFATIENYFCSNYLVHLGEYWLNQDYVMLPFGELRRRKEFLFDSFGIEGHIFVRPDSPLKLFTGQTAGFDSFEADVEFMAFYEFPAESIVVVSTPKQIARSGLHSLSYFDQIYRTTTIRLITQLVQPIWLVIGNQSKTSMDRSRLSRQTHSLDCLNKTSSEHRGQPHNSR